MFIIQLGRLGARRVAQRRGYAGVGGTSRTCPSCGTGLPTALPVCPRCRYIGRVHDSITHHELLGLPYGPNPFVIDTGDLKRRFLQAQRLCHPDGWATRSEQDREAAQQASNAVNTAYKTLLSPLERIGYVLRRNGREMGEAMQVDDMALMAEVMEVREAIEESEGEALERLKEANDGKMKGAMGQIEEAVGRADWGVAQRWAVRLKYLAGIEDAIRRRTENADIENF